MVRLIPSKVFMKDPVDAWGKDQTIGLSELAVRTHAPPMAFDRRGDVIFYDDFESSTQKYTSAGNGSSTSVRSADTAKSGELSLKGTTDSTNARYAAAQYLLTDYHTNQKLGVQASFASTAFAYEIRLINAYCDGTTYHLAYAKYIFSTGTLQYYNSAGVWTTIATGVNYGANIRNWSTIKLVFDVSTDYYVRLLAFGKEYDLSDHAMSTSGGGLGPYLNVSIQLHNVDALNNAKVGYFDNVIITENEPA